MNGNATERERNADLEAEMERMSPEALDGVGPRKVRAKFAVTGHTRHHYGHQTIMLEPRYDDSIPEDRRFYQATPSGKLEMTIDNPAAIEALMPGGELGKTFYIDLTPAD